MKKNTWNKKTNTSFEQMCLKHKQKNEGWPLGSVNWIQHPNFFKMKALLMKISVMVVLVLLKVCLVQKWGWWSPWGSIKFKKMWWW
jgi:hypothetical protein